MIQGLRHGPSADNARAPLDAHVPLLLIERLPSFAWAAAVVGDVNLRLRRFSPKKVFQGGQVLFYPGDRGAALPSFCAAPCNNRRVSMSRTRVGVLSKKGMFI